MATFTQWLTTQQGRNDPVGEFARYWKDLEGKPRLSSPSSIAAHLEGRESGGFRDTSVSFHYAPTIQAAYDATLSEYRRVRAGIAQAVVDGSPAPVQPELPGMPPPGPPEAAGGLMSAVADGFEGGTAGVSVPEPAPPPLSEGQPGYWSQRFDRLEARSKRIEHKLDILLTHLALPAPLEPLNWAQLYSAADLAAEVE